jgi:chorismate mutase
MLRLNSLNEEDIISLCFSMTSDLDAKNPAAALREAGRGGELALMVFQEAAVKRSLPHTIRAIIHCCLDEGIKPRHVYMNGAEVLRPDRR